MSLWIRLSFLASFLFPAVMFASTAAAHLPSDAPAEPPAARIPGKLRGVFDAGYVYEGWWWQEPEEEFQAHAFQLAAGIVHLTAERFSLRSAAELSLGFAPDSCADDCASVPSVPTTLTVSGTARAHARWFYAGLGVRLGVRFWNRARGVALGELVFGFSSRRRVGFHAETFTDAGWEGWGAGMRFGTVFPAR
ncbi:MAG: hypothetical protein H5U40_12455 [Polyangiaceae bacterium]|nr:hypothetical protein [Polyangiaceae bacterium]